MTDGRWGWPSMTGGLSGGSSGWRQRHDGYRLEKRGGVGDSTKKRDEGDGMKRLMIGKERS